MTDDEKYSAGYTSRAYAERLALRRLAADPNNPVLRAAVQAQVQSKASQSNERRPGGRFNVMWQVAGGILIALSVVVFIVFVANMLEYR